MSDGRQSAGVQSPGPAMFPRLVHRGNAPRPEPTRTAQRRSMQWWPSWSTVGMPLRWKG